MKIFASFSNYIFGFEDSTFDSVIKNFKIWTAIKKQFYLQCEKDDSDFGKAIASLCHYVDDENQSSDANGQLHLQDVDSSKDDKEQTYGCLIYGNQIID